MAKKENNELEKRNQAFLIYQDEYTTRPYCVITKQ